MTDQEKLAEISRLLDEAYKHYFSYEGHCKSSEGYIHVEYGNYWDRYDNPSEMKIKGVHIYSYVFCSQGRSEDFDSIDEALETVRGWHAEEMAYDFNAPEEVEARKEMDEWCFNFVEDLKADGRLTIIEVGSENKDEA